MSKWIKMSIMGVLLALAFGSVPSANASAPGRFTAKSTCRTPGICNQSCVACLSSQACPDYPNEVCLCGQRFCP
jgi:hypothetical protein